MPQRLTKFQMVIVESCLDQGHFTRNNNNLATFGHPLYASMLLATENMV